MAGKADNSQGEPAVNGAPTPDRAGQYTVVARRYRPQTFDELIGQEHVARALKGAIAANRVGHAYLFTGARGVGKTSAARILAKALDCQQGPTATPCGRCDICLSIAAGSDVDVLEIDGASNRGIDEIRQLRQNVNIRPSRSRYKIYIIDEVHMLTREAFNALLKTLEEPPEHVKFIFCTTEATKLPVTILSRCQRFDFAGIQLPSIVERLRQIVEAEGASADPEALALIARRAGGSMRDSQSLLEQMLAFGEAQISVADVHAMLGTAGEARMAALVEHLAARDAAAAVADLDAALDEAVDVGQLLEQLLGYFRDLMVAAVGCPSENFLHTSAAEHARLAATGKQLGLDTILAILQIIDHTLSRLRYSTQGRTLAEMALVRIANLENLDELAELLEQLRCGAPPTASGRPSSAVTSSARITDPQGAKKKADALGDPLAPPTTAAASPAPTIEPGAPSIALSSETAEEVWQQALAGLGGLLGEHAARAQSVTLSGPGRLVVAFEGDYTFNKEACERPEQRSALEAAVATVAGTAVKLEFVVASEARPRSAAPARAVSQRQRLASKADNSLVRRATELFDAHIVDVKDPGDAARASEG